MRLTSKGRYAARAMLDLTFNSNGNPVRLQEISNRQAISLHYLEQLFRKLRTGRVVKSVRGPGGGYVLARSMDEISIKDVLDCVGENINPAKDIIGVPSSGVDAKAAGLDEQALADGAHVVDTVEFRLTKSYFENLGILMQEYLTTATLGDLFRKAKAEGMQANQAINTFANTITSDSPFAASNVNHGINAGAASSAQTGGTTAGSSGNASGTGTTGTGTNTGNESVIRPNIGEINQ